MPFKIFFITFGLFVISLAGFLYYMDLFSKIKFIKKQFPKTRILYRELQSEPSDVNQELMIMIYSLFDFFKKKLDVIFICYDNQDLIQDQRNMRFIIGVIIDGEKEEDIAKFIAKNLLYKKATLRKQEGLYSNFKHKNFLSHLIGFSKIKKASQQIFVGK